MNLTQWGGLAPQPDSDALIQHFAVAHSIDASGLPALTFYEQTLFPQIVELHKLQHEA